MVRSYSVLHHSWMLGMHGLDNIEHISHVFSLEPIMTQHKSTETSSTSQAITNNKKFKFQDMYYSLVIKKSKLLTV